MLDYNHNIQENEGEDKTTKIKNKLITIITRINKGDYDSDDVDNFIGGFEKLLQLVDKYDLSEYIDPFNYQWGDYQNLIIYHRIQKNPDYIDEVIKNELSDITESEDEFYWDLGNPGKELAVYFSDNRNDLSRSYIESIINGDDVYDNYYDVTDNVYRDVYQELESKYQSEIKRYITEELQKLTSLPFDGRYPDLFDEIASEQNKEDEVELTENVIPRLINDDDTLEYLINKALYDQIGNELYSLYSGCYSSVHSDEIYHNIMGVIVGELIDNDVREEFKYKKYNYRTSDYTTAYGTRFKVTNAVRQIIKDFIYENKNEKTENISYFGKYSEIISYQMRYGGLSELRTPRISDYPDHRQVIRCMNDNFNSYF